MSSARHKLHTPAERRSALAMAVFMNLALGFVVLSGLAVDTLRRVGKELITFNVTPITETEPQREVPPPQPMAASARLEAGPAGARATRAPVIVPTAKVPIPTTSRAAVADELAALDGDDASTGAAASGPGSGAGGLGTGPGGGGTGGGNPGAGSGGVAIPARLLSGNLNRGDYSFIRSLGSPRGGAVLDILVGAEGRLHECRPLQSSGDRMLDDRLCQLLGRTSWAPARNAFGQAVPARLRYVANWRRN